MIGSKEEEMSDIHSNDDEDEISDIHSDEDGNLQNKVSIVSPHGEASNDCGYCKSNESCSKRYGMMARQLMCSDYQDLIDRGWRRSGKYLYKPTMHETCCPQYTIRLDCKQFVPTKDQKNVTKKLQRYLQNERSHSEPQKCGFKRIRNHSDSNALLLNDAIKQAVDDLVANELLMLPSSGFNLLEASKVMKSRENFKSKKKLLPESTEESGFHYQSAFALRLVSALKKEISIDKPIQTPYSYAISVVEVIQKKHFCFEDIEISVSANGFINFELRNLIDGTDKSVDDQRDDASNDFGDSKVEKSMERNHELVVSMVPVQCNDEIFQLYKRYQVTVHGDSPLDLSESRFKRFLVDSPLIRECAGEEGSEVYYGSFFQLYRLDSILVAVGVIDVLPSCLSSVYCFYDPDYSHLSLGKLTALKEIEWVQSISATIPNLKYYYLGYYVHSCPKMRYKGAYGPSELLCPEGLVFVPFDKSRKLIDDRGYSRLSDPFDAQKEIKLLDQKSPELDQIVDNISLLIHGSPDLLSIQDLATWSQVRVKRILREYACLVGPYLAKKMHVEFH